MIREAIKSSSSLRKINKNSFFIQLKKRLKKIILHLKTVAFFESKQFLERIASRFEKFN